MSNFKSINQKIQTKLIYVGQGEDRENVSTPKIIQEERESLNISIYIKEAKPVKYQIFKKNILMSIYFRV